MSMVVVGFEMDSGDPKILAVDSDLSVAMKAAGRRFACICDAAGIGVMGAAMIDELQTATIEDEDVAAGMKKAIDDHFIGLFGE